MKPNHSHGLHLESREDKYTMDELYQAYAKLVRKLNLDNEKKRDLYEKIGKMICE